MDNKESKIKYRLWAKDLRQKLDLKNISVCIENKIRNLEIFNSSKTVMSYLAKDLEVSLANLFSDNSKEWFLPVVVKNEPADRRTGEAANEGKNYIIAVPYIPGKTELVKNKFDILEPKVSEDEILEVSLRKLLFDIILVPGLCFDKNGNRIGFGKGFYDSFLKLNPGSIKIGCCPKECLVDKLPMDDWDIKVDMVITP